MSLSGSKSRMQKRSLLPHRRIYLVKNRPRSMQFHVLVHPGSLYSVQVPFATAQIIKPEGPA
jgi:hypothetical protein